MSISPLRILPHAAAYFLISLKYAVMAEVLGRAGHMGPESVNCSAPDTGNMGTLSCFFPSRCLMLSTEVLARYANAEQQKKWLIPLLNGEIRSAFAMTERFGSSKPIDALLPLISHLVASSDATNIRTSIVREGNEIVINGHKWSVLYARAIKWMKVLNSIKVDKRGR